MQGLRNTNLNRCKNYRFIMRLRNYSEASNSSNTIYFTLTFDVSADWILFGAGDKEKREYASEVDEMLQAFYSIRNPRARKIAIEQIRALSVL